MIQFIFSLYLISGITGKIQGVVSDTYTDEPIPYADVIIAGTEMGAATDAEGRFYILNVPPGRYTVEVSYIGYQTKRITDVVVEIDRTTRLEVDITQTMIEISPITVTSQMPSVQKDYVATTYIVRKSELPHLPIDYTTRLVAFQAAVAHTDTGLHVRGGRANEVLYMIDNVSILDPQTGDMAINLSKGVIDEIIFLPGGFDAEYGRAMSGVINLISSFPKDNISARVYGKTETIMPFYQDFGYQNYQASLHLPVSKKFKGLVSFDLMHTDDWDPKLYILPHKNRDDYSVYGKWFFSPSGKFKINVSGAKSRTQFDRYETLWRFHLDHYRSDMRTGDLQVVNLTYLPTPKYFFTLTTSRLSTQRNFGVRIPDDELGLIEDFQFKQYEALAWPTGGKDNPFGSEYWRIICSGDYEEYQEKSSDVIKTNFGSTMQIHKFHELKAGFEYVYYDFMNFTYFISDSANQLVDEYQHYPTEYSLYLQDNVDFEGLYAKIGCRYDYFDYDIPDEPPKTVLSPRFGFSFMVTEQFLFRANIGRYAQPPLYDYLYSYHSLLPLPSHIDVVPPIGNPSLDPEKTTSLEIGLQGEIAKNISATVNIFNKDVSDLIGTKYDTTGAQTYISYFNVEYAKIRGLEMILEFQYSILHGKISYTLSKAKGTSSYALEAWERRYYDPELTPAAEEFDLDFDQPHRLFVQGLVSLPFSTNFYVFGYFGNGFPYTKPGSEGKYEERNIERLPVQKQLDCVISKTFKIGNVAFSADFEVINVLGERYFVNPHFPVVPIESIKKDDFDHDPPFVDIHNAYYAPGADLDHDGMVVPYEEYLGFKGLIESTDDWVNAYTAPRRARLGVQLKFN
jgi:outer membrane receptor protein involved in Fe transport